MTARFSRIRCKQIHGGMILITLSLILFLPFQTNAQTNYYNLSDDLEGVNVAVYTGSGVLSHSRTALTEMFKWMNATVEPVSASRVLNDFLDDYDIVVFPGGPSATYSSELGDEGKQKIVDFVTNGGSYFGICGGSVFGASSLDFFDGTIRGVNEPGEAQHLSIMHINQSSTGPDLSDCPENVSTMYWSSSYFSPASGFDMIPIATYDYNDEAGMIAFEHEAGTVFLSSPHPEYEEGDDRDDTPFRDDLNDPDSEWDILFRVSTWLIEASIIESTTNDSTTPTDLGVPLDLTMIGITSIGIVAVVMIVILLNRRKLS
ncbi:MAG: BPL-N domain-containing protein [Candidatus Thorarchaeota archaeon]|jgi:biotin--protein ligase